MSKAYEIVQRIGEALVRFSEKHAAISAPVRLSCIDLDVEAAFWARVEKTDSCWLWRGSVRKDGGGDFSIGRRGHRKSYSANRISWQIAHGLIDDSVKIFPAGCNNRRCVNPAHLRAGSARDCAEYGIYVFNSLIHKISSK